jgi:hypothetical protein
MNDALLSDALSPFENAIESKAKSMPRRRFMQTTAVVAAGFALWPKNAVAEPAEAGLWRDRTTQFVNTICEDNYQQAESINRVIRSSPIDYAQPARTFHDYYAAPLIFTVRVLPQSVICHNGFQVYLFPFYDIQHPVRGVNDLNAYEVRRVTNQNEMSRMGCVVAPTSTRMSFDRKSDHADYSSTAKTYGFNPDEFTPEYKRVFTGRGRSRLGYQVKHKTAVGQSGKPLRDILLSDQDW